MKVIKQLEALGEKIVTHSKLAQEYKKTHPFMVEEAFEAPKVEVPQSKGFFGSFFGGEQKPPP